VIGDTVNIAARLQTAAEKNQILITEKDHEKVKESFKCREMGPIDVKNKQLPLVVYEVLE